ncbi:shufflon system plasmid conjugative transfer pilus tip adhesin PilV [Hydrogenophaga sp. BPS33]|uniref:shufflon system plasmid conjugative transfer pilus tip adhesin PilV n=1 Tax=Hydrogenophaga sp. BPS33 TaxID=2651974 RepID=UPI00131FBAE2|nr:shufflon system plasmid conjugative transfer pilus tip adhesin PilV [Hydrogenophaga sp. BPS33]QHE89331.1 shufflon system plasmid conjugative transfer pilus tip adhesin PilV [Hydrogenophaga sp. BPS33]
MKNQKGVTLLEIMIALVVFATIAVGVTRLINVAVEDTEISVAAAHSKSIGQAASAYIKDNYAVLQTVATPTTPALVRVEDLVTQGYLETGFSTHNGRGQAACVLVLQPTAGRLNGLVITEGGEAYDDLALGQLAATIGGSGAGVYTANPTNIRGAMGGFDFPVGAYGNPNHLGQRCDGSGGTIAFEAGHPAVSLWFGEALATAPTLYRDQVPGDPSLNTMNTPILLGVGTIQTAGAACSPRGALARDTVGGVLTCEEDVWRRAGSTYWRDPVANAGMLGLCDAAGRGQTRVVLTPSVGTGPRAYTCDGTGAWAALGVDDTGSIRVEGTATINRLAGTLEIAEIAAAGAACVRNGSIAREVDGKFLSCQAGVWTAAGGGGEAGMYAFFDRATCPDGWVAANGTNGTRDLRGEFIRGWDAGRGVDSARGLGSSQLDALQQITGTFHNFEEPFGSGWGAFAGQSPGSRWYGGSYYPSAPVYMTFDSARVTRSAAETRGRNVALLACMKEL